MVVEHDMIEDYEYALAEGPDEAVHWMPARQLRLSPATLSTYIAGAFLLGAAAGVALAAVLDRD